MTFYWHISPKQCSCTIWKQLFVWKDVTFCYNITLIRVVFKVYLEKIQDAIAVFIISLFYLNHICRYGHIIFWKNRKCLIKDTIDRIAIQKKGTFSFYEIVREQCSADSGKHWVSASHQLKIFYIIINQCQHQQIFFY